MCEIDYKGLTPEEIKNAFPSGEPTQKQIDSYLPFVESNKSGKPINLIKQIDTTLKGIEKITNPEEVTYRKTSFATSGEEPIKDKENFKIDAASY